MVAVRSAKRGHPKRGRIKLKIRNSGKITVWARNPAQTFTYISSIITLHLPPDRTTPAERWSQHRRKGQEHRNHELNKKYLRLFDNTSQNNPKPHKKTAGATLQRGANHEISSRQRADQSINNKRATRLASDFTQIIGG